MPGQPVKIGPFVGGMNTYSGPSAIADSEAVEIRNMDIDLDGSLVSRPALETRTIAGLVRITRVIGTYTSKTGVSYMIYAQDGGGIFAVHTGTQAWTTIDSTGDYTACVQYNDKLWMVKKPAGTAVGGSSWDPTAGLSAVATMPRGVAACIYKERMFIASSVNSDDTSMNRLKFSGPANPASWTSTDTLDVKAGDGQDITALYVFDNNITVFKTDSTYVFAYESQPTKGQVQIVNGSIGCNNVGSVLEYENSLFVMHESKVYRISNWSWEQANLKIPFQYRNASSASGTFSTSISSVGNRIVCRYYDNYYVLGTKTGAWTIWNWGSTGNIFPSEFLKSPVIDPVVGADVYYAANHVGGNTEWYRFTDTVLAPPSTENYVIKLVSKAYDFGVPYGFKRLFWWGADLLSKAQVNFRVTPIAYNTPVTWGMLAAKTFADYQTWGRPLDISIDVTDLVSGSNPAYYRTFLKLLKGLRFRQIQFTLDSTSDGTTDTGPLRIFTLTAFVDNKELVSKKVS